MLCEVVVVCVYVGYVELLRCVVAICFCMSCSWLLLMPVSWCWCVVHGFFVVFGVLVGVVVMSCFVLCCCVPCCVGCHGCSGSDCVFVLLRWLIGVCVV